MTAAQTRNLSDPSAGRKECILSDFEGNMNIKQGPSDSRLYEFPSFSE